MDSFWFMIAKELVVPLFTPLSIIGVALLAKPAMKEVSKEIAKEISKKRSVRAYADETITCTKCGSNKVSVNMTEPVKDSIIINDKI